MDLRKDKTTKLVPRSAGEAVAQEVANGRYMECSALTQVHRPFWNMNLIGFLIFYKFQLSIQTFIFVTKLIGRPQRNIWNSRRSCYERESIEWRKCWRLLRKSNFYLISEVLNSIKSVKPFSKLMLIKNSSNFHMK